MGKIVFLIAAIIGIVFLLKQCGPSQAGDVAFTGTWKIEAENGISGTKDSSTITVTADKNKFRTVTTAEGSETTDAYDGETLQEKFVSVPAQGQVPSMPAEEPVIHSEKMSVARTGPRRFWSRSFAGQAGPGGQIAGQETLLYQVREKRPDGELSSQAWVDAKTGIALKSVETIYSSQVNSMVSKVTRECQEIKYEPVDSAAFDKI